MDINHSPKESFPRARKLLRAAAVAGVIGAGACAPAVGTDAARTEDEKNACIPSRDTQEFTYTADRSGVYDAVHSIAGSGKGEGDACWSEGEELVRKATGLKEPNDLPQHGQTIIIPRELNPQTAISK